MEMVEDECRYVYIWRMVADATFADRWPDASRMPAGDLIGMAGG